ncbi:MAG: hypothetical protein ABFD54_01890 [Armatimonadota bacterium]|nr:hypothetical protein [bacterium]
MKHLIEAELVNRTLAFLAVGGPLVGLIIGMMLGAHERKTWVRVAGGVLIGLLATVAYGMWLIYGWITDRLGLDSVSNLCIQLVLFAILGIMLGIAGFKITNVLRRLGACK